MAKDLRPTTHEDRIRAQLTFGLLVAVVFVLVSLFYVEVPDRNRDMLISMSNQLLGAFIVLVSFYSKTGIENDRQKDQTIHTLVAKAPSAQQSPDVKLPPGESVTIASTETRDDGPA